MPGEKVLVTGASGYIASHIVNQLLQQNYQVRGTVRNKRDAKKVNPILKLAEGRESQLELVEADLLDNECWSQVVDGCAYVLHTASPFPNAEPETEDELIKPAVDGTVNVLKACTEAGCVKRVVITSSIAAIGSGYKPQTGRVFTEADWSSLKTTEWVYEKSKTLAEKAAWEYMESSGAKFGLAVVNPGLVLGPVLCGSVTTSIEIMVKVLSHDQPMVPKLNFAIVDVRDVAAAHLAAMTLPDAVGKRHILCAGNIWFQEIAQIVKKEFQPLGYKIPTGVAPYLILWFIGRCDKMVRMILPKIGKEYAYDNSRMLNVLQIQPRSLEETIIDMCYSLIEAGHVRKTEKYKPKYKY